MFSPHRLLRACMSGSKALAALLPGGQLGGAGVPLRAAESGQSGEQRTRAQPFLQRWVTKYTPNVHILAPPCPNEPTGPADVVA